MCQPQLHTFVSRGPKLGTMLYPHQHRDGRYAVSMTRFAQDYIYIDSSAELLGWLEQEYSLRMSNRHGGVPAASLIAPSAIFRPVVL